MVSVSLDVNVKRTDGGGSDRRPSTEDGHQHVHGLAGRQRCPYSHRQYASPAVVHHRAFHLTAPRPVCSRWTSSPVQLWYYVSNEWTLGEMMCKLSRYVQGVVIVNCILTLTGIAVDRSVIIQEQVTQLLYPYVYVCTVSVCTLCNTITFENLHTESLFLVCKYVFAVYGSSSYMKVI